MPSRSILPTPLLISTGPDLPSRLGSGPRPIRSSPVRLSLQPGTTRLTWRWPKLLIAARNLPQAQEQADLLLRDRPQ